MRRIAGLEARKQKLLDAVVDGRIDKPTYDTRIARVGTEANGVRAELSEMSISAEQLECLLEFAAWMLERVSGKWE
jgi:hypothetical protein